MKPRGLALAACALFCAAPLLAQHRNGMLTTDSMKRVRPSSCPIADSLAGRALSRPSHHGWGWRVGKANNLISSDPFARSGKRPIDGIILTAASRGEGPHPDATYALQLRLRDTVLRKGAAAALSLTFDDSVTDEIGEMRGNSTPFSQPRWVDQMLTQMLAPRVVRQLVTATKVTGSIGPTSFEVPQHTLETFRAVFIGASCGERL